MDENLKTFNAMRKEEIIFAAAGRIFPRIRKDEEEEEENPQGFG